MIGKNYHIINEENQFGDLRIISNSPTFDSPPFQKGFDLSKTSKWEVTDGIKYKSKNWEYFQKELWAIKLKSLDKHVPTIRLDK